MRLGCDPLHRHLLPAEAVVLPAWQPFEGWCELLREGELDAVLISLAAMAATGLLQQPADIGPGIKAVPLGRRPLVLLHGQGLHTAADRDLNPRVRRAWQLLLPPAAHQPLLWRQLRQLGLLPLQRCHAATPEALLQELSNGPFLLPAPFELLELAPWRDAGLRAVPPPEPLEERLWLLVRQGEQTRATIGDLAAHAKYR